MAAGGGFTPGVERAALDPVKAYRGAWMMGPGAKPVRVLAEMMEPEERLRREHVNNTILFFGSARSKSREEWEAGMKALEDMKSKEGVTEEELKDIEDRIRHMKKLEWMCEYYEKVRELSKRITEWSMARLDPEGFEKYVVSTGGGPGMMEAANRGAFEAGGRSVGIGISLPFENKLNEYITPELAFSLHYFFTRKFWLLNPSVAMIVCPGGLGTLDEMFEATTLLQTRKMGGNERQYLQEMPIVLLGEEYWRKFINVQHGVDAGTCSPMDTERLYFTSSVDDAFDYVTSHLERMEKQREEIEAKTALTPEEKSKVRLAHLSKEPKAGLSSAKLSAPITVTPEDAKEGHSVRDKLLTGDSAYDVMAEEMDRSDA